MPALTIRIDNAWYSMAGGKVAKADSKTTARTRLQNATAGPVTRTEAAWMPVMRISEQIRYEAAQRLTEVQAAKEMPA